MNALPGIVHAMKYAMNIIECLKHELIVMFEKLENAAGKSEKAQGSIIGCEQMVKTS